MRAAIVAGVLAAGVLALGPAAAWAANAGQPYSNVDRSNDKGNDTGNSRVESLNNAQSDENQGVHNPALGSGGTAHTTTTTVPR